MARTLSPTVGFVGVGNMGGAIAARLLESGPIIVWDGDADRAAAFADKGATVAPSGPDLAANCEIILTCLPESRHVESVLFDEDGLSLYLNRDVLIADMTTGDPTVSRQIASRLLEQHVHFVDAPVSGGPSGVAAGTLAIMIGGEDDAVARARPVFERISPNLDHVGPVGAGHALKLANNMLNAVCRLATAEAVALAVKNGIDPALAVDVMQKSSGRNYATEITFPRDILSGVMGQGFTVGLMHKDVRTACELAGVSEVPRAFGEIARKILADAENRFGFDADVNCTVKNVEAAANVRIRGDLDG